MMMLLIDRLIGEEEKLMGEACGEIVRRERGRGKGKGGKGSKEEGLILVGTGSEM